MSETDSLYRISISPPRFRIPRGLDINAGDLDPETPKLDSRTRMAQGSSSKSSKNKDWTGNSRGVHEKHVSYVVPTAPMVETPSKAARVNKDSTHSKPKGKGKERAVDLPPPASLRSKRRDEADFQDEADRAEKARDLADPDFGEPSTKTRKRRAVSHVDVPQPTKRARQHRSRHRAYDECKDQTKEERDRHIERIVRNWNAPREQLIPQSMVPTKKITKGKDKGKRQPRDTKDWNGRLLAELSYLSGITKDNPEAAYKALQDAISRTNRFGGGPQLLEDDVKYATLKCQEANSKNPRSEAVDYDTGEVQANDVQTHAPTDEDTAASAQLPSPRSPTFAGHDRPVKLEAPSRALPIGSEASVEHGWDGYDDQMDKLLELKLEAEENEARAAAKRAERERVQERRRLCELMRQHGKSKDDAILLRTQGDEQ